jgi:hypothetical protein
LVPRAHGTPTIKQWSFDVRSWGPSQATPWKKITSELGRIIVDHSLRPCWTAFLSILHGMSILPSFSAALLSFHPECFRAFPLYPDRFDHLHVFSGKDKPFSLKIVFHMLFVRGTGQWKHPDLHGKSKHDLRKTGL